MKLFLAMLFFCAVLIPPTPTTPRRDEPEKLGEAKRETPVEKPVGVKANLMLIVKGSDGTLSVTRDVYLPFIPASGMVIDLQQVRMVQWVTYQNRFLVTFEVLKTEQKARDFLRIMTHPSVKWDDLNWEPKKNN